MEQQLNQPRTSTKMLKASQLSEIPAKEEAKSLVSHSEKST